jgi:hypothetical protein
MAYQSLEERPSAITGGSREAQMHSWNKVCPSVPYLPDSPADTGEMQVMELEMAAC